MNTNELRALIQSLPPIQSNDIWSQHRRSIRQHILSEDIDTFLQWSTISATMYVGDAPFIYLEREAIPYYMEDTNLIHQAYHLYQWEQVSGQQVKNLSRIMEFGGGYGAMCLVCRKLGFEGSYWIKDYPELSHLQEYYLSGTKGTFHGLPHLRSDLFIASHSLSEVTIEERDQILRQVKADSFLFVFHCEHNGVDNLQWFRQVIEDYPQYHWQQWATPHLPNQWYQVGVKR